MKDTITRFLHAVLPALCLAAVVPAWSKDPQVSPGRYTGDSYGELHSPRVKDEHAREHQTCWSCLFFGSYPGDGFTDPARRFRSTLYAKCRGAWWSPKETSLGRSFWFLRTNGYTQANAVYVGAGGDIYNRGMVNTCKDAAVLPAIVLDLSRADYQVAPPVRSDDVNQRD